MATSVFYNNFQASQEQELLNSLIIESIRIFGNDVYYIPRKLNNYDSVYGADDQSSYELAILMEMYIKSYDGFKGDGNFMSKFGIEIRDQVMFSMSQRIFDDEVSTITTQPRPNEGDLIYFPLNKKCFQIKYVEKFAMFYPLGTLYTWDVTCELFEYSNERISTGIPEIDSLQKKFDVNAIDWTIKDQSGNMLLTEDGDYLVLENSTTSDLVIGDDSSEIQKESDLFVDFTIGDPFSLGNI
jgi:Virus neck protein